MISTQLLELNGADAWGLFPAQVDFFSELCWGKTMVAYTKPQQRKKGESKRLRGDGDKINFIDLRFGRWQVGERLATQKGTRSQKPLQSAEWN